MLTYSVTFVFEHRENPFLVSTTFEMNMLKHYLNHEIFSNTDLENIDFEYQLCTILVFIESNTSHLVWIVSNGSDLM